MEAPCDPHIPPSATPDPSVAAARADATPDSTPDPAVVIFVCDTCRRDAAPEARLGPRLLAAVSEAVAAAPAETAGLAVRPVSCLANCERGPSAALVARDGWSYVFGGLGLDAVDDIIAGARLLADDPSGRLPLRGRPAALKAGLLARIPPVAHFERSR